MLEYLSKSLKVIRCWTMGRSYVGLPISLY